KNRCPFIDGGCEYFAKKLGIASCSIFGGELHFVRQARCESHGIFRHANDLRPAFLKLVLKMDIGGRDENMDWRTISAFECLGGANHIALDGSAKCGYR